MTFDHDDRKILRRSLDAYTFRRSAPETHPRYHGVLGEVRSMHLYAIEAVRGSIEIANRLGIEFKTLVKHCMPTAAQYVALDSPRNVQVLGGFVPAVDERLRNKFTRPLDKIQLLFVYPILVLAVLYQIEIGLPLDRRTFAEEIKAEFDDSVVRVLRGLADRRQFSNVTGSAIIAIRQQAIPRRFRSRRA